MKRMHLFIVFESSSLLIILDKDLNEDEIGRRFIEYICEDRLEAVIGFHKLKNFSQ